jgi:hypothetical protein
VKVDKLGIPDQWKSDGYLVYRSFKFYVSFCLNAAVSLMGFIAGFALLFIYLLSFFYRLSFTVIFIPFISLKKLAQNSACSSTSIHTAMLYHLQSICTASTSKHTPSDARNQKVPRLLLAENWFISRTIFIMKVSWNLWLKHFNGIITRDCIWVVDWHCACMIFSAVGIRRADHATPSTHKGWH